MGERIIDCWEAAYADLLICTGEEAASKDAEISALEKRLTDKQAECLILECRHAGQLMGAQGVISRLRERVDELEASGGGNS